MKDGQRPKFVTEFCQSEKGELNWGMPSNHYHPKQPPRTGSGIHNNEPFCIKKNIVTPK